MYNERSLYYLNQLGITPWITRGQGASCLGEAQNTLKLVVFSLSNQSKKAQILLKRMMAFVALDESELLMICVDNINPETAHLKMHQVVLANATPLAVLTLGVDTTHLAQELNLQCPILSNFNLDHLLHNPAEKRKVFNDLLSVLNFVKGT
ncbi:MAG: DNA polymerase III subunit psi [Gammaproteobacteria bacterium]